MCASAHVFLRDLSACTQELEHTPSPMCALALCRIAGWLGSVFCILQVLVLRQKSTLTMYALAAHAGMRNGWTLAVNFAVTLAEHKCLQKVNFA